MLEIEKYEETITGSYAEETVRKRIEALESFMEFLHKNKDNYKEYEKFDESNAFKLINDYLTYLIHEGKSPNTIKLHLDAILNYCAFMGIKIDPNEKRLLKMRIPPWSPKIDYLTVDEVKRLLTLTKNLRHRLIYALMYTYARRLGEVLLLTMSDVNLEKGTITFQILKKRQPETATFKLDPFVKELLENYIEFEGIERGKLFDIWPQAIRKGFKKDCEAVGIKPMGRQLRPHMLRHSRITHLIMQGWKLEDIAKNIARHSNYQTTYKYYMGLFEKGAMEVPTVSEVLGL